MNQNVFIIYALFFFLYIHRIGDPLFISSGADVHCESDSAPHSCSNRNEDKEKLKYHFHVNEPPKFRGVYPFPVDPIPRRNCFDEEAMEFLQKGVKRIAIIFIWI